MQQAPAFLATSIRSAFQTSKLVKRATVQPAKCVLYQKPLRGPSPRCSWAIQHAPFVRSFHHSHRTFADNRPTQTDPIVEDLGTKESSESMPTSGAAVAADSAETQANIEKLPSHQESRRSTLSKRFNHLMDTVQSNVFVASQRLNDLTGYSGIEALKREIEAQEIALQETRKAVKVARDAYAAAIATRSSSQREVNDLLQRKHAWSPADLERFTNLYRSDHANGQMEAKTQEDLSRMERQTEEAASKLSRTILARYHEEQIWSDKIRRMSTWGTWGLMGLNVLLFLLFQVAVEPWRRRRLVRGFEEKVMEALEKENANGTSLAASQTTVPNEEILIAEPTETLHDLATGTSPLPEHVLITAEGVQEVITPIQDLASDEKSYQYSSIWTRLQPLRHYMEDLFNDKKILTITQVELTTKVLQGMAGGAAITGLFFTLLRSR